MSKSKLSKDHLSYWENDCSMEDFKRWCGNSEVLINFFKPFLEEERGQKEINDCVGRFKMDHDPENGIILHRMVNSNNQTTRIYTFFYFSKISEYLNSISNINFRIFNIENTNSKEKINCLQIKKINQGTAYA